MARPFGVALTGGIGSGKSTVAAIFEKLGASVIDADEISHALTGPGGAALEAISSAFGPDFVGPNGLDRAEMRKLVFSDEAARRTLESILHPVIRAEVERRISACTSAYYLLVIPLYFETGRYAELADRVLVVDCSEATQISRTMARSGLSREEVLAIMERQVPRSVRVGNADDLLKNEGSLEAVEQAVARLDRRYLELINIR